MTLPYVTPKEFLDYYTKKLQKEFDTYNIKLSRAGFLGFLLELLAWNHYDVKNYYDQLFKEAFVATAQRDTSLAVHSATYGYQIRNAIPAEATGVLLCDFSQLPRMSADAVRREVRLVNTDESPTQFSVNDRNFIIEADYTFILEVDDSGNTYNSAIIERGNSIEHLPSTATVIDTTPLRVALKDAKQYVKSEFEFTIPDYDFGSHYTYEFDIGSGNYIKTIQVFVKERTDPDYDNDDVDGVEYEVSYVKYFAGINDAVVFMRNTYASRYALDFGSGLRGKYVPGAKVKVKLELTNGYAGNINVPAKVSLDSSKGIMIYDYDKDGNLLPDFPLPLSASTAISVEFEYSENGQDPLTGEELRKDLIKFIQSRDNFLTETDFYNIAGKYLQDFRFVFKKTSFLDNIFYLFKAFRDRYQNIIRTTSHCQQVFDYNDISYIPVVTASVTTDTSITTYQLGDSSTAFDITNPSGNIFRYTYVSGTDPLITSDNPPVDSIVYIESPNFDPNNTGHFVVVSSGTDYFEVENSNGVVETGKSIGSGQILWSRALKPGTYYYQVCASDGFGLTEPSTEVSVSFTDPHLYRCVELTWNNISNYSVYRVYGRNAGSSNKDKWWEVYTEEFKDLGYDSDLDSKSCSGVPSAGKFDFVFYPEFFQSDLVSPFLYKYNEKFRWYDGYLVYKSKIVYFNELETYNNSQKPPSFHIVLEYDKYRNVTSIYLKSAESINHYNVKVTVEEFVESGTTTKIIDNEIMTCIDENSFVYEYSIDPNCSIFWHECQITVDVYDGQLIDASGPGYVFTNGSDIVDCQGSQEDFDAVNVGDYIFLYTDTIDYARKVISKDAINKYLILEGPYNGSSGVGDIIRRSSLQVNSRLIAKNVKQTYDVSDQLRLYTYQHTDDTNWVLNIPSIDQDVFNEDPDYYMDKILGFIYSTGYSENRLITDNIQCRFLNTYEVSQEFLPNIFKQNYSGFDLKLPIRIIVNILVDKDMFDEQGLSVSNERDNLALDIATYLQETQVGTDTVLYPSQIEDIVHTRNYVKSVSVQIKDAENNDLSQGLELRKIDEIVEYFTSTDKLKMIKFVPVYIWFNLDPVPDNPNLNGIEINFTF